MTGASAAPLSSFSRAAIVFVAATAVLLPGYLVGAIVHDEGFVATGAMLTRYGWVPYRDFLSFYGPAIYYIVGALFSVLGEDLLVLRLFHVATLATLAVVVDQVCRGCLGVSSFASSGIVAVSVAISLVAGTPAGYAAVPAALLLVGVPLIGGFAKGGRRTMAAAALVATAGLLRWDFGVLGLVALLSSTAWTSHERQLGSRAMVRVLWAASLPWVALMAAVYGPLIVVAGPWNWLNEVLFYHLFEFPKWRAIPFVAPALDQLLHGLTRGDVHGIYRGLLQLLYLALPLAVSVAAIVLIVRRTCAGERCATSERDSCIAYLAMLTLLLLNQMRVRPSFYQGFPAVQASLPLLALGLVHLRRARTIGHRSAIVATFFAAAALLTVALDGALKPLTASTHFARARATAIGFEDAVYPALVDYVRANSSVGDRIYSGAIDHSRFFICDSLLYFLADRKPADRFMELEPGIANSASGQQTIRDGIEATRPPLIVLADLSRPEPNATAVSNGLHQLDHYIRSNYEMAARFGWYIVLRRRGEETS